MDKLVQQLDSDPGPTKIVTPEIGTVLDTSLAASQIYVEDTDILGV